MSKSKMFSVTINCKGLESDVNDFIAVAKRYGVTLETLVDDNASQKAARSKVSKPQKAASELTEKQAALIESYKAAGCFGYYVNDKGGVIPVAKHDETNNCYWLAKTSRNKVSVDDKGRIITLYNDRDYKALKTSYLNDLHSKHTKAPKNWKRDKIYKALGYLVPSNLELTIVAF